MIEEKDILNTTHVKPPTLSPPDDANFQDTEVFVAAPRQRNVSEEHPMYDAFSHGYSFGRRCKLNACGIGGQQKRKVAPLSRRLCGLAIGVVPIKLLVSPTRHIGKGLGREVGVDGNGALGAVAKEE